MLHFYTFVWPYREFMGNIWLPIVIHICKQSLKRKPYIICIGPKSRMISIEISTFRWCTIIDNAKKIIIKHYHE